MSDKKIDVEIKATNAGFGPAMRSAAESVETAAESMRGEFGSLVTAAKSASVALAGLAAASAIGAAIGELVAHVTELGVQFAKASQQTGVAATELSALSFVATASDVSFQSLVKGMEMMDRQLLNVVHGTGPAADAFKALGVSVVDASGHLKSNGALLDELADKFADFKDSPEKTALAMHIFGRAGAEMIPILNLGSAGIKQLKTDSDALGATMSTELIAKTEQYHHTMVEMHAAMQGTENFLAGIFIPILRDFAQDVAMTALEVKSKFTTAWIFATTALQTALLVLSRLSLAFELLKAGHFKQVGQVVSSMATEISQAWTLAAVQVEENTDRMLAAVRALTSDAPETKSGKKNAPPGLDPDAAKKAAKYYLDTLSGAYKDAFEMREAALHEEEAAVTGSAVEQARQVVAIKRQELQQIIAFYGQYSTQAIAAEGAVARATRELNKAVDEETKKMLAAEGALWKSTFASIGSTFNTVFDGLLRGTQNFRQAFGSMILGLGGDFIKVLTKMGAQWAAHEALKTGILSSSLLQRLGLQTTADASGKAIATVKAVGQVTSDASVGAAGAASAMASVPYVGPALAVSAAAETFAMIMGFMSGAVASAAGGYDIPAGVNPVTQLHAQEMVLPAALADKVRAMSGGGDTYHIHAMDVKSFHDYVQKNATAIGAAVKKQARTGALTLTPAGTFR